MKQVTVLKPDVCFLSDAMRQHVTELEPIYMSSLFRSINILLFAIISVIISLSQITLPQQPEVIKLAEVIGIMKKLQDKGLDSLYYSQSTVLYAMELKNPDSAFGFVQNYPNPFSQQKGWVQQAIKWHD